VEEITPPPEPPDRPLSELSVDDLAMAVRYHNWRYFTLADPIISDEAFDRLTRRLTALAPGHPALAELVGGGTGERAFHDHPMLSLDKAYDVAGVLKWASAFEGDLVESPKIDGVAASLKYDADGRLIQAVTRGDGQRGEIFTANAAFIEAIPKAIGAGPVEVRGEIFLPLSTFRARFEGTFANPRNTCAGAIKQKEAHKTGDYDLSFYGYSVLGLELATMMEAMAWGEAHGIPMVESRLVTREEVEAGYASWLARRDGLEFEIDGVVYVANQIAEHARLGATSHHPRWAIAYKLQGESGTTTIEAIEWSVSRTGAITPVAIVAPIVLSGATVTRCSLHNLGILASLGASVGATVVAMRRGGVIPHIEGVLAPGPEAPIIPRTCPVSGHPTEIVGDVLMCSEPHHCPAAVLGTLEHFVKAVEIDGFGPRILTQLLERGLVREPADFFTLERADLERLERLGRRSADNLVRAVAGARRLPLPRFLRSLGIATLGNVASDKLAEALGSLEAVRAADEEAMAAIHGIGPIMAEAIRRGLESRRALIDHLLEHVVVEEHAAPPPVAAPDPDRNPIAGRSFVFTGKLAAMERKNAQARVKALGGATPSGVSRGLDYLVVGDDGSPLLGGDAMSSKQKAAEKLVAEGVDLAIITEAAFRAMLEAAEAAQTG